MFRWLERIIHWLEKNEHPRKGKTMADLAASVPSTPRNGQYLAVFGLTDTEGGGDIRIEVEECPECAALVEQSTGKPKHESWHAAQAGATPKSR